MRFSFGEGCWKGVFVELGGMVVPIGEIRDSRGPLWSDCGFPRNAVFVLFPRLKRFTPIKMWEMRNSQEISWR